MIKEQYEQRLRQIFGGSSSSDQDVLISEFLTDMIADNELTAVEKIAILKIKAQFKDAEGNLDEPYNLGHWIVSNSLRVSTSHYLSLLNILAADNAPELLDLLLEVNEYSCHLGQLLISEKRKSALLVYFNILNKLIVSQGDKIFALLTHGVAETGSSFSHELLLLSGGYDGLNLLLSDLTLIEKIPGGFNLLLLLSDENGIFLQALVNALSVNASLQPDAEYQTLNADISLKIILLLDRLPLASMQPMISSQDAKWDSLLSFLKERHGANPAIFVQLLESKCGNQLVNYAPWHENSKTHRVLVKSYLLNLPTTIETLTLWQRCLDRETALGQFCAKRTGILKKNMRGELKLAIADLKTYLKLGLPPAEATKQGLSLLDTFSGSSNSTLKSDTTEEMARPRLHSTCSFDESSRESMLLLKELCDTKSFKVDV